MKVLQALLPQRKKRQWLKNDVVRVELRLGSPDIIGGLFYVMMS
jgi:hypothetical protein